MAAVSEPLLTEKVYFANCPGCRQDRKNEANPGIPYKEFIYIWVVTLCSGLPISSLFPFLYFMIRDLHIAKRVEDIGYYAGFVGGAYMFGRALTSVLWGIVADRYGRKPVIVISIVSLILFNTLFGLSTSYWMAITTRFLLGASSGLLGPIKAYATEVCRKEYQALGLSLVSTSRGIGLILGPAIGGFFAQPADKYPDIFSKESFFGRFPYFLPCFFISLIGVGASISCFWLPETLHIHSEYEWKSDSAGALEASLNSSFSKENERDTKGGPASKENLFRNWPLMSSMIVFCVFSLHDMAYSEIFSLWAVSDKIYGGLSFSSGDVGEILAISGFTLLLYQLFLYAPFVKAVGPINSTRISAVLMIPLLAGFPYMVNLSGIILKTVVNCASILKYVFSMTIITGLNILQNNAVSQNQRGAANGISVTAMSLFKTAAPAGGGAISAARIRRRQPFWYNTVLMHPTEAIDDKDPRPLAPQEPDEPKMLNHAMNFDSLFGEVVVPPQRSCGSSPAFSLFCHHPSSKTNKPEAFAAVEVTPLFWVSRQQGDEESQHGNVPESSQAQSSIVPLAFGVFESMMYCVCVSQLLQQIVEAQIILVYVAFITLY